MFGCIRDINLCPILIGEYENKYYNITVLAKKDILEELSSIYRHSYTMAYKEYKELNAFLKPLEEINL